MRHLAVVALLALAATNGADADEKKPVDLFTGESALVENFRPPSGDWFMAADAFVDPGNAKLLKTRQGTGVAVNGEAGHTSHLVTKMEHGDCQVHIEFMVPEGSNSGVYLQGRYEVQVLDSWGVEELKYGDCGGLYQRWHDEPGIEDSERGFEGVAPRVNAAKAPGEWQSFDITFRAPRFDEDGNKIKNALFEKVVHNGAVIHENVERTGPTRSAMYNDEKPEGPIMLQGDHGPVAYRCFTVTPLEE
ncbi:MAG: DUF1080 domain-containing protein [Candidatus Hydrogenedentes bacterium]|nr:DUF1080 domain-containing protein [Candidatus Hydrogenedentota bacterium]